jgi:hypothetical protein
MPRLLAIILERDIAEGYYLSRCRRRIIYEG